MVPSERSEEHFYCDLAPDLTITGMSQNWIQSFSSAKLGSNFLEVMQSYSGFFLDLLSRIAPDSPICSKYDGIARHSFEEMGLGTLWVAHGFFAGNVCVGYRIAGHNCLPCKTLRKESRARIRSLIDTVQYLQSEATILSGFLSENKPARKILGKVRAALDKTTGMVQTGYREVNSFSCQTEPVIKKPTALVFPKQESGTVLIVEDDEPIRETTKRILETLGYTILTASSAEEAFGVLDDFSGDVDLFLIDLGLPGMSGVDFVKMLLQDNPDLKIIVLTGFLGSEQHDTEISDKVIHWLEKPVSPNELITYVKSAIKKRSARELNASVL